MDRSGHENPLMVHRAQHTKAGLRDHGLNRAATRS
jgi:hypothetical protein